MDFQNIGKECFFTGDIYEITNSDEMDRLKEDIERGLPLLPTICSTSSPCRLKKEKAILVKVTEFGGYVELENLLNLITRRRISQNIHKNGTGYNINSLIISDTDFLLSKGDCFVKPETIEPYDIKKDKTSIKELKKEIKNNR